jgi:hypothetical protein
MVFVVNFCHLILYFSRKKVSFGFDKTWFCIGICHSYPLHPIFLKLQLDFQTSYMNMKSIHISILKIVILKQKIYTLILNIFISMWKFVSQFWKLLFKSKKLILDYANYYMKFNILNIEFLIKFWKLLFEKKNCSLNSQIFIFILKIIILILKNWYLDVKIDNSILKIEIEITNF